MRYFVTGAAGFIGSHLVRGLLTDAWADDPVWDDRFAPTQITVFDKLTYAGNPANLEPVQHDSRFTFVRGDICDGALLDQVLPGHDVVINFAAETHVDRSITGPQDFVMTNVVGTQALFDACRRHRIERVVHIGTDEVYGSIEDGSWSEACALLPNSPYSAAKASAELLARAYHQTYGVDICTTRCSNNYGPYQFPEKVIPLFVTNLVDGQPVPLYGDGGNVRDWLHVDDHCRAILLVLRAGAAGESYNVGGGQELTNLELTRAIVDRLGVVWDDVVQQVPDRAGHDRRYSVDDSRLRALGYRPRWTFAEGLDATIAWYLDNEKWWRPLRASR